MTAIPTGWMQTEVYLQARTVTKGANNADVVSWVDAASSEWAYLRESATAPAAGGPAAEALAAYARPAELWLHWRAGFDKSATRIRLVDGSRLLRIVGSAEVGRQDKIKLTVQEWGHE